ncbi:hypothetical protein, partial [Bacillus sp. JJ63]|uniref:hypothetical protein n=1 Tax=Bacillus sp. JJ63 TaxID=3122968 RepID=UPI002FFD7B07
LVFFVYILTRQLLRYCIFFLLNCFSSLNKAIDRPSVEVIPSVRNKKHTYNSLEIHRIQAN